MSREHWDRRFLALAEHIAGWSKDPSTKVGAVLVDDKKLIVGLGYNGFPRGVHDSDTRYNDRMLKYQLVVHAEVNAILMAKDRAAGATLYVWPSFLLPPICNECCKVAIQAGVREIVGFEIPESQWTDRQQRWAASIYMSQLMCHEAGVTYRGVTP